MTHGLIENIIDIPGVAGVCVFHASGKLYEETLPSFYNKLVFDDLIRRVVVLYETIDDNYIPCDEFVLKFGDMFIRINRSNDCFLMVFLSADANLAAVKMVSRLAIKNLDVTIFSAPKSDKPGLLASADANNVSSKPLPPPPAPTPSRRRDDDDDDTRRPRHSYRGTQY